MIIILCITLVVASAALTHFSVRSAQGWLKKVLFALALSLLGAAFAFGDVLGGFWPGVYVLLSVYFLTFFWSGSQYGEMLLLSIGLY